MEGPGKTEKPPTWKVVLFAVAFLATFLPYAVIALLVNPLDLISFVVAWLAFAVLRNRIPETMWFLTPLICALLLSFPSSAFRAGGSSMLAFLYFVGLMTAAHHLAKGIWVVHR